MSRIEENIKEKQDLELTKKVMESISPTYCAAKWLNSTIWLYCGETASCHHLMGHSVNLMDLMKNGCDKLHNTPQKIKEREEMLLGKKPRECSYCWDIERHSGLIGDRLYKTAEFSTEDIEETLINTTSIFPKYLEIAFDNICNMACCYCTSKYSSRIASIKGDPKDYGKAKKIYMYFFWKWLPDLLKNKTTLRITGGEPLLHRELWELLKIYKNEKIETPLIINTNLSVSEKIISDFIDATREIKNIQIYTSCETVREKAEYIRDGMSFELFEKNLRSILSCGNFKEVGIMATLTNLSVLHYTEFLNWVLEIKEEFGCLPKVHTNILRNPRYLSVKLLSEKNKEKSILTLESWLKENKGNNLLSVIEIETVQKLLKCLTDPKKDTSKNISELKKFLTQYDVERNKNHKILNLGFDDDL